MNRDLFGEPYEFGVNAPSRGRFRGRTPSGYAAAPGTGPKGETCGSCAHHYCRSFRYHKCALIKPTKGTGTDIRVRAAACSRWEQKAPA